MPSPVQIEEIREFLKHPASPPVPVQAPPVNDPAAAPVDTRASFEDLQQYLTQPAVDPGPPAEAASLESLRQYLQAPEGEEFAPGLISEATRGFRSGVSGLGTSLLGVRTVFNKVTGDEEEVDALVTRIRKREKEHPRKYPRTVHSIKDVDSLEDFARYAARGLGETIPFIASVITTGGLAGIVVKLAEKKLVNSVVAKQIIAKYGAGVEAKVAEQLLGRALVKTAAGAGVYGAAATLETGFTAVEQASALGDVQPGVAITAGAIKGALEAIVPSALGARVGLTPDLSRGLITKLTDKVSKILPSRLAIAPVVGAAEGVTEVLQEAVDLAAREFVDENYDALGPEGRTRLLDAGATGAIVGTILGPLIGGGGRRPNVVEPGEGSRDVTPPPPPPSAPLFEPAGLLPAPPSQGLLTAPADFSTTYVSPEGLAAGQLDELTTSYIDPAGNVTKQIELADDFEIGGLGSIGEILTLEEDVHILQVPELSPPESEVGPIPTRVTGETLPYRKEVIDSVLAAEIDVLDNSTAIHTIPESRGVRVFAHPETADSPVLEKIAGFYKDAIAEYGLNENITIVFSPKFADNGAIADFAAKLDEKDFGLSVIELNSNRSLERIYTTAVHEFGHLLVHRGFATAPIEIKSALQERHNADRIKAYSAREFFFQSFIGLSRAAEFAQQENVQESYDFARGDSDYFFGFDEWMAEQLVRAQTVSRTRMTATETWFSELAGLIRKLFYKARAYFFPDATIKPRRDPVTGRRVAAFEQFAATKEFEDFLNYIKGSTPKPESDLLRTFNKTGQQESKNENRRILSRMGIQGLESAPPRTAATAEVRRLLSKVIPGELVDEISAVSDRMNWFMKVFLNLQQIALENPSLQPLHDYVELVDRWYVFQMDWVTRADTTVRKWLSLGRKQNDSLARFIYEVENMEYLRANELTPRLPTEQETAVIAEKHGLSKTALELYNTIRQDFLAVFDLIEQISLRDAQRTIKSAEKLQEEQLRIKTEFEELRRKPYFPHARFGEYAIVVRNTATGISQYIEHFESHRAAKANLARIASQYPESSAVIRELPQAVQAFQGLPGVILEKIREKLDPTLSEEQKSWLDDYINELALSTGMRKKLAKRRDIPGFSLDAMRAFAQYFFTNAKYFARIEYGSELEATIKDLDSANALLPNLSDASRRDKIRNYMMDHYQYIMNPKGDWAALRSLAFSFWLGFHVKSAVVNFTQVPIVGYPYLAARFGDAASLRELGKAVASLPKMYNAQVGDVTDSLLLALDRAVREGVIDESQATELAGIAQGAYVTRMLPGIKAHRFLLGFNQWSSFLFQAAEKMNRRVVFRAAWELAQRNNANEYIDKLVQLNQASYAEMQQSGVSSVDARAYLAAKDAVRTTQYHYANHARPLFMRGKKGVLTVFYMFAQQTVYFAARQPGRGRYWLLMLAAGGLMGLPGAEDLLAFVKVIGRKLLGTDFDPEKELRKLIIELADGTIPPDLILNGTSRYGFGIPAAMDAVGLPKANFDLSGSMSMGQIVPGLQQVLDPIGHGFDENFSRATTDIAGAAFGTGINLVKALTDNALPADDFKRWERAFPRALANVAKAYRFAHEGRERTRTGATVVNFDMSDPTHVAEVGLQALGFPPTRLQQRWDREMMIREIQSYWTGQRSILFARFDQSFILRDPDMRQDAIQDIFAFNKRVPYPLLQINVKDMMQSRTARLRERRRFEAGFGAGKKFIPASHEVNQLFPEIENFDRVR